MVKPIGLGRRRPPPGPPITYLDCDRCGRPKPAPTLIYDGLGWTCPPCRQPRKKTT